MTHPICKTCGVQYDESPGVPASCMICDDDRQYVGWSGQEWTTLAELREGRINILKPVEPGLTSIVTAPKFGIGQHALLLRSPGGNVLWDCVSLIDDQTVAAVRALGGVSAVAISHPHYYGAMVEWSRAFDGAPILVHEADRRWVA